jgi:uncharacterized protein YcfJ
MQFKWKAVVAVAALGCAAQAAAQITLYEGEGFRGRAFNANGTIWNLQQFGFNDRASSVIVERGRWEVCEDARFGGRCVVLRRGNYPSLGAIGINNRISSLRPVTREVVQDVPPPPPAPVYEYRVRPSERLYTVDVASVHAVVGPPEQRCWVERQQFAQNDAPNVPGAIIGGIIGGVLGHQVGSGRGRDVATGVGAVGGAAIGANVGRGPGGSYTQDVQRCTTVPSSAPPAYWDVTYWFQGVEHRVQMSSPPGRTITVNERGEPRG